MATSVGIGNTEGATVNTNSNKIDTSKATGAKSADSTKSNNSLDKDAFLQLLVTQMQYQDPLEPTSNTEYMSQLAQFSQLEAMNNLSDTYANSSAFGLVGKYVIMNVADSNGNITQKSGLVDYVTVKNGDAMLNIGGEYYPYEDLDSVVDTDYLEWLAQKGTSSNS